MAKVQSRRSISLNHKLWELVHEAADQVDESASEFVAKAVRERLRRKGKTLPDQWFAGPPVRGRDNGKGSSVE